MRPWTVVAVTLLTAGCGDLLVEPSCDVDADVFGIAILDPVLDADSGRATLRLQRTVGLCMIGRNSCTLEDQRFEFRGDAPSVVTVTTDPSISSPECNALPRYPCCPIRVGRLTAVGAGTAGVEGVLLRGGTVEKTGPLLWCPKDPFGACRPLIGVEVTP